MNRETVRELEFWNFALEQICLIHSAGGLLPVVSRPKLTLAASLELAGLLIRCCCPAVLQRDRRIPLLSRRIWRSDESRVVQVEAGRPATRKKRTTDRREPPKDSPVGHEVAP